MMMSRQAARVQYTSLPNHDTTQCAAADNMLMVHHLQRPSCLSILQHVPSATQTSPEQRML